MSRTRPFNVEVTVNNEFLRDDPKMAEAMAVEIIRDHAREPLTGPRGGRYEPIPATLSQIVSGETERDFVMNRRTYRGRVMARYVRPSRSIVSRG